MTRTLALSANAAALMATLFLSVSDASATVTFNGRVQVRGPMGGLIRYHAAAWRQPSHLPPSHSRFSFSVENTTASTVKFVVCWRHAPSPGSSTNRPDARPAAGTGVHPQAVTYSVLLGRSNDLAQAVCYAAPGRMRPNVQCEEE